MHLSSTGEIEDRPPLRFLSWQAHVAIFQNPQQFGQIGRLLGPALDHQPWFCTRLQKYLWPQCRGWQIVTKDPGVLK